MKVCLFKTLSFFKSIRSRIILSIALTAVIASLLVGFLSTKFSTTTIEDEANQKLSYMAKSYANFLEGYFSEVSKIVNILDYDLVNNIDKSKIHDDKYMEELIKRIEPTVKMQAQNSSQGKTAYVYFNPKLTGKVHDVYYADQDGDGNVERQSVVPMEYYTDNFNSTEDKSWWFTPVSTHRDYWGKPYNWKMDNGKVVEFMSYTRAIYLENELLCVIGSDFTYDNIREKIDSIKIYKSGFAFLLNSNYEIISHPLYSGNKNIADINKDQFKQSIDNSKKDDASIIKYKSSDGSKKVTSLAKMSNGWIIGMTADEKEILSRMISLRGFLYILIGILSILSILLSLRLGNMISKPIIAISNIVRNVGDSNYRVDIPGEYLQRKDEIGILSVSIKTMSEKITDDIEEINHQNNILKYDALTNATNKDYFRQLVNIYIDDTKQSINNAAMMIINIDNFRVINETMSYDTGNMLLCEISRRLFSNISELDLLSRTNGDEFTIFFKKIEDLKDMTHRIDKIFLLFNNPFNVYSEEIFVSISAGISLYPDDSCYHDELFKNASSAVNHVKSNKKNRYEFYQRSINKITTENYEIINNLRYALSRDEFELYYQPQIDIQKNMFIGVEALLRWNSPKGSIPPSKFIPLAEESNIIIPIGEWVLSEACKMGVKLIDLGFPIKVGVNISAVQFKETYLVELIENIFKETGLPPSFLDIEITESILMDNSIITAQILKKLKDMGIGLSIDDFGTGYSSLAYLKNYVVDKLKIDRSFIKDIPYNDDGTIAKTIINLSKGLGIKVIAEGIEEKEQLEFLLKNGCDEVQGYYYSKPIPEDEIIAYIRGFDTKN
ncbi:EAL domain-containing protein [Clostridium sp.]|uniref:bifunctional diguanylate cyclase/phosphodiesterase n=1 Tax=Clostridium sp. TaxID=1506 RepID=UPI001A55E7AF|nr:EAL domain-containing protein [Clostridium sp.]MBK5236052.1 EAL domain-containing protein [Clostridium sp.]